MNKDEKIKLNSVYGKLEKDAKIKEITLYRYASVKNHNFLISQIFYFSYDEKVGDLMVSLNPDITCDNTILIKGVLLDEYNMFRNTIYNAKLCIREVNDENRD